MEAIDEAAEPVPTTVVDDTAGAQKAAEGSVILY